MSASLLSTRRPHPERVPSENPIYPEYPIAQTFGSDDPATREQLMRQTWQDVADPESARFVADREGLRVLARSEGALKRVAGILRQRYGTMLFAQRAEVRYLPGTPALEPYMVVLVNAPARYLAQVRKDLLARRGRITRVVDRTLFVLEGEAPLADLLGYYDWMRDVLGEDGGRSHVATWLSRYVPIDGGGPEAA